MNAWKLTTTTATLCLLGLCQTGCTSTEDGVEDADSAYAASGGIPPAADDQSSAAPTIPASTQRRDQSLFGVGSGQGAAIRQPPAVQTDARDSGRVPPMDRGVVTQPPNNPSEGSETAVAPFTVAGAEGGGQDPQLPELTLRPDLSPEKLLEFLAGADQDLSMIVTGRSGITDPAEAKKTLLQIVKMKLEASRQLAQHADTDAAMKSEGNRGELQALSHLAALGDVKVAEQLEELALENLESSDPKLVADSRLVLIGFAIESLQNGDEEAANRILNYVKQIADADAAPDVPAMMVMGQAREVLASYGRDKESKLVRDMIIDLFADSPEPQIAQMAAQLAGNVRFDGIDRLRKSAIDGDTVSVDRWTEAVGTLIDESADLQTVRYLAGVALEFEALKLGELANATYEVMESRFTDPSSATQQEVRLAVEANAARRDVIGREFDPELTRIDGSPLSMDDYVGKVVVMPFWAMAFPESLQLIPRLTEISRTYGDGVAIVGVNLDAEGAQVAEFVKSNKLGFPSYRAVSSATAEVANPVAARFGMVSMPFTAILDKKGRVAALDFNGQDLESTVQRLLEE